jgi:hypothetical protein
MILYKYLSPERLDVLRDAKIRYTQPRLFNDPFELRPYYKLISPPERAIESALSFFDFFRDTEAEREEILASIRQGRELPRLLGHCTSEVVSSFLGVFH